MASSLTLFHVSPLPGKPKAAQEAPALLCQRGEIAVRRFPQLVSIWGNTTEERKNEGCWLQKGQALIPISSYR